MTDQPSAKQPSAKDFDFLLVDGSSYLYRAFHAMPDLRAPDGRASGALYGVITMLNRLRKEYPCALAACVFDAKGPTIRHEWFADYKANRPPMPADLVNQLAAIHQAVIAMGWPKIMQSGLEADDIIATLAQRARAQGLRVLISTPDKDLAQLVSEGVTLINTMSNQLLDSAGVQEKFGVPPERIVDYLTLVGDSSDNIPGVDKVGVKTAVKLLNEYGSLDNLLAQREHIPGVVGANLRKAVDWLPLGRKLVTVIRDCQLPADFDDIRQLQLRTPDWPHLGEFYRDWGLQSLRREVLANLTHQTGQTAPQQTTEPGVAQQASLSESAATTQRKYETVRSEQALREWIERISQAQLTAMDTETTGLDNMTMQLVGISLCVTPDHACYIPLGHQMGEQLPRDWVLAQLRTWLEDPRHAKLGQNVKFDQHVFANAGITLRGYQHDTMLQSYVLESHLAHNLDSLAQRHLHKSVISFEDVVGKGVRQLRFDQVEIERASEYASEDADLTLQIHRHLYPQIEKDSPSQYVYRQIEMRVTEVLGGMERTGVLIDAHLLREQSQQLATRMLALEQQAYGLAGREFNLGSPKQLGQILFEEQKLPVVKKTASGTASTDEEVLLQLADDFPLPKLLLEYRALAKLRGTYTDKLPQMICAATGRVHTTYSQAVAITGRLASNDPNLQNIPVRTAEGRRVREAFIAPAGCQIVSADYSQIELRIMAHMADDENMIQAFASGQDIHSSTAAEVFGVTLAQVSKEQRNFAKTINFGLIYGMGAFGLAKSLHIQRSAAQSYMDRYFARYPKVAQYMDATRTFARDNGYVQTAFGRRLWLPDMQAKNPAARAGAERAAINAPVQGTAADLIKLAMIAVDEQLRSQNKRSRMIMQVHDELVFEVPDDELPWLRDNIPALMTQVHPFKAPLEVSVGVGLNWDQAH